MLSTNFGNASANTSGVGRPFCLTTAKTYLPPPSSRISRSLVLTLFFLAKPIAAGKAIPSLSNALSAGGPLTRSSRSGWFGAEIRYRNDKPPRRGKDSDGAMLEVKFIQQRRNPLAELGMSAVSTSPQEVLRRRFLKERLEVETSEGEGLRLTTSDFLTFPTSLSRTDIPIALRCSNMPSPPVAPVHAFSEITPDVPSTLIAPRASRILKVCEHLRT